MKYLLIGLAGLVTLCLICGVFVVTRGGDDAKDDTAAPSATAAPAATSTGAGAAAGGAKKAKGHTVTYEVTGSGTASVTYIADLQGSQEQQNDVALPFTKEISSGESLLMMSVVAQRKSGDSGEITCRILLDGKEVKKSTSSGSYAVATCAETKFG
jgi:hypothetical protein